MAQKTGIETRHSKKCRSRAGGTCSCEPTYRAMVWSRKDERRIYNTFPKLAEARAWRSDALTAVRSGRMRAPTQRTLREAGDEWIRGARDGTIRTRSGRPYKPSTIRSYALVCRRHRQRSKRIHGSMAA